MQGITSLGHVAIRVSDVDRTLAFYTGKLGAVGERAPAQESNRLNHICLTVVDLDEFVRQLEARHVPLSRPLKLGADGNRQTWIEDPDGNRIELMEMAADGLQAKAIERLRQG